MQTRSAAAALGVLLAAVPASEAAAQTAAPTLQFDRTCYTEHMDATFTGAGYTPGGEVNLLFSTLAGMRGVFGTQAGPDGALNGNVTFPDEDEFQAGPLPRHPQHGAPCPVRALLLGQRPRDRPPRGRGVRRAAVTRAGS